MIDYLIIGGFIHDYHGGREAACIAKARATLDRWCDMGLPCGTDAEGGRLFDPVEVANFNCWSGLFGHDDYWRNYFVPSGRTLVAEFSEDGGPRDFHVRLSRRFGQATGLSGERSRLFLKYPVSSPSLELLGPPCVVAPEGARIRIGADRLDVTIPHADGAVEISADYHLRGRPRAGGPVVPLSAEERALYLQPHEGFVQITRDIADLARILAGPERSVGGLATRFRDYIHKTLIFGTLRYDQIPREAPLEWMLGHRWFDCQLGSALLVALCRARQVPARICAGHLLYRHVPGVHYWAELWCPDTGWRGHDLLSWGLSMAGEDTVWREAFSGTLDLRLQTECLPRHFTGMGSLKLPARWHILVEPHDDGMETLMCDADTGAVALSDRLAHLPPG